MNVFHLYILSTLIIGVILAILMSHRKRHRFEQMPGMIVAMVMGMNFGLTSGLFFGTFYHGNLYFSTVISMGFGAMAGLACGISLGMLPALEGFMSGLMGGMMGAMLGEMITGEQSSILVNIMLALTVCSLLLFNILPVSKTHHHSIPNKKWYLKPLLAFVFILMFFVIGSHFINKKVYSDPQTPGHENLQKKGE